MQRALNGLIGYRGATADQRHRCACVCKCSQQNNATMRNRSMGGQIDDLLPSLPAVRALCESMCCAECFATTPPHKHTHKASSVSNTRDVPGHKAKHTHTHTHEWHVVCCGCNHVGMPLSLLPLFEFGARVRSAVECSSPAAAEA